ncbi:MAG: anti-sigma F factor [Defluviitaleaceae bacterium]|nr:anti-sigma F factor [Defluviitaleaceae bacterium]
MKNEVQVTFPALIENASLARLMVMGVLTPLDVDTQQLTEIKTVVSEAMTNAIIHGYEGNPHGLIELKIELEDDRLAVMIKDNGVGIDDVEQAKQPLFTTKEEEERSGLGFMIMESFTDEFHVDSAPGVGTTVTFERKMVSK